jgi:hypothetical protein
MHIGKNRDLAALTHTGENFEAFGKAGPAKGPDGCPVCLVIGTLEYERDF